MRLVGSSHEAQFYSFLLWRLIIDAEEATSIHISTSNNRKYIYKEAVVSFNESIAGKRLRNIYGRTGQCLAQVVSSEQ
jgi:hypothetical protein